MGKSDSSESSHQNLWVNVPSDSLSEGQKSTNKLEKQQFFRLRRAQVTKLIKNYCFEKKIAARRAANIFEPTAVRALPRLVRGSTLPDSEKTRANSRVCFTQIWLQTFAHFIGDFPMIEVGYCPVLKSFSRDADPRIWLLIPPLAKSIREGKCAHGGRLSRIHSHHCLKGDSEHSELNQD